MRCASHSAISVPSNARHRLYHGIFELRVDPVACVRALERVSNRSACESRNSDSTGGLCAAHFARAMISTDSVSREPVYENRHRSVDFRAEPSQLDLEQIKQRSGRTHGPVDYFVNRNRSHYWK